MSDNDGWIDFKDRWRPTTAKPYISLHPRGTFTLNRAARELLGDAEADIFVRLRYNPKTNAVGMLAVDPSEPSAYQIHNQKSSKSTWVVAGKAFCHHFNIPLDRRRRFIAQFIKGERMLVIELDHEAIGANRADKAK